LALPGFGSLVAGRRVGYPQAILGLAGLALTMVCGTRFIWWSLSNWSRLHDARADQFDSMIETFRAARWSLLGILVFALGWLWALATSLSILNQAKKAAPPSPLPPRL
jgi:hypothetical protein